MALINSEEINNIRSNTNIVDIISSYIKVEKKGKDYKCVCPFHDDHSPSMSISEQKQIYKCFACGAAGNVFTFVQNYENISFLEAVKVVADKINYHLTGNYTKVESNKYKVEHEIMNLSNMFYQNNLNTSSGVMAKQYLSNRGINDKIIKEFGIGLSLDGENDLYKLLSKKGYSIKQLDDLGLINVIGDKIYDVFRGRITFPINDVEGNVIGYSSRIYRGEDLAKYINTKETYLYVKGNNLFNYFRARGPSKKNGYIILVEGQMDAIRVYSSGVENVVALMGTALTKEQIDLIKKLRCKVLLCLDGDVAGAKATVVNGELLNKADINVQVVRLSDYKDPDEYILNKGIEAFIDNINNPIDYIDFKIKYEKDSINTNNAEELATFINKVIDDVSLIKDDILREVTLNKISEEYNISMEILKSKLKGKEKVESVAKEIFNPVKNNAVSKKLDSLNIAIRKVLYYMMNDVKYIKIYQNKIGFFEDANYRAVANEIVYYYERNKTINVADFLSHVSSTTLVGLVQDIVNLQDDEVRDDTFNSYIKVIEKKSNELKIKQLKKELKDELDVAKRLEIANRITEIKKGSVLNYEES